MPHGIKEQAKLEQHEEKKGDDKLDINDFYEAMDDLQKGGDRDEIAAVSQSMPIKKTVTYD